MKIRTRIATAVSVALATLFVSTPAFAHGDEEHSTFSSVGEPVHVIPILIVGIVLLVITLLTSTWVGNLFEKKD